MQRESTKAVATLLMLSLSSACTSAAHFKRDELKKLDGLSSTDDHARAVQGLPPTARVLIDEEGQLLEFGLREPLTLVKTNGESTTARFDSVQVSDELFRGKGDGVLVQAPLQAIAHAEAPRFSPVKTAVLVTALTVVGLYISWFAADCIIGSCKSQIP